MQPGRLNCVIDTSSRTSRAGREHLSISRLSRSGNLCLHEDCALKRVLALNERWTSRRLKPSVRSPSSSAPSARSCPSAMSSITSPRWLASTPRLRQVSARLKRSPRKEIPKGPLQIIISVDQQKLHLYSDGMHVADAPVATGVRIIRRRSAFSASSRKAAIIAPTSIATRRCRSWSASPGRASLFMKASIWAIRLRRLYPHVA